MPHTEFCEDNGFACTDPSGGVQWDQPPGDYVRDAVTDLGEGAPWCQIAEYAHKLRISDEAEELAR